MPLPPPTGVELIKQLDSIRPLGSALAPPPHLLRSQSVLCRGGCWACRPVLQLLTIDPDPRTGREVIKEMVRGRPTGLLCIYIFFSPFRIELRRETMKQLRVIFGGGGGWSEQGLVGNVSSAGDLSFIGKQGLKLDS